MRLGQLARKLALPPSEITEFLVSQQINVVDGANARLDENHVSLVLQRFAPELFNTAAVSEPEETVVPEVSAAVEEVSEAQPVVEQVPAPEVVADMNSGNPESPAPEKTEDVELIKAPKVTLSGLKVLGKIELPEKKKKPEAPAEETTEVPVQEEKSEPQRPVRDRRGFDNKRRERRDERPRKNPVALAREREAQAAEEKRKEEEKLRKEQRTQNYMKRVQAKAPTKAAKLIREDVIDMSSVDMRPAPKTLLGKFWRWFRS